MKLIILLVAIVIAGVTQPAVAQDVAVKTNLLSDAFYNPNIGVEVGLAPKWSLDVSGQANFWDLSHGRRWKHWAVQPEIRYWFCEAMGGHFLGAHLLGGQYNIGHIDADFKFLGTDFSKLKDHRYQGWFGGIGVARYDLFECEGCGRRVGRGHHNYVGPTKAAINVVYVF